MMKFQSCYIFFLTHTNTQIPISAHGCFFSLPQSFFKIYFPVEPTWPASLSDSSKHKSPQSILSTDCYFSQYSIDTTVSKLTISFSVYTGTANMSYSKNGILQEGYTP